jgi:hypothetical protein
MILAGLFGWLVGLGASPWFLVALLPVTYGFVTANKSNRPVITHTKLRISK